MSMQPVVLQLVLQLVVVLVVCRAVGAVMTRVGQPRVIGEMIAGILLGPSLLGWLAPTLAAGPLFERAWRGSAEVSDGVGIPVR